MLTFSDVWTEGATPDSTIPQQEEKDTQGWVHHSVGWFQRGKFNFVSYTFHIPWKEVVKGSTGFSEKEIIDFPMA